MRTEHLNHILDSLPSLEQNYWQDGYTTGIHNAWIRTVRRSGRNFHIDRSKKNRPYITLKDSADDPIGVVTPWNVPTCTKTAGRICQNKVKTQKILHTAGINVPWYQVFGPDEADDAFDTAFAQGRREVVVKAPSFSQGLGVFLNVTEQDFKERFHECVEMQKERKREPSVIVQEMVDGFELRVTVVEGEFFGSIIRIPAYVTGDGTHNIEELMALKTDERQKDRARSKRLLRRNANMEAFMRSNSLSFSDIPEAGERVLLSAISNISFGAETANITDIISEEIRDTAVRAVAAIPGLYTGGVDIMVRSLKDDMPRVLEVNSFPHATSFIYPTYGESINPIAHYLDSYYAQHKFAKGTEETFSLKEKQMLSSRHDFCKLKLQLFPTED